MLLVTKIGFRVKDVDLICISVSIKKNFHQILLKIRREAIGQKGLGLKSVFGFSEEPLLVRNECSFKFDSRKEGRGVEVDAIERFVTPHWVEERDIPKALQEDCFKDYSTKFFLPASPNNSHQYLLP